MKSLRFLLLATTALAAAILGQDKIFSIRIRDQMRAWAGSHGYFLPSSCRRGIPQGARFVAQLLVRTRAGAMSAMACLHQLM
jgi:hypothetical protein